jgi:hypothetical protein
MLAGSASHPVMASARRVVNATPPARRMAAFEQSF